MKMDDIESKLIPAREVSEDTARFIKSKMDFFEDMVLFLIKNDPIFWKRIAKNSLCVTIPDQSKFSKKKFDDFTKPIDNLIYNEINSWYSIFDMTGKWADVTVCSNDSILKMVRDDIKNNQALDSDFNLAEIRLNSLTNMDVDIIKPMVLSGYLLWLEIKRTKYAAKIALESKQDLSSLSDTLKSSTKSIGSISKSSNIDLMSLLKRKDQGHNKSKEVDLLPILTFPRFTSCMKGGIPRSTTGLIIAPSNAGKTVVACQFMLGTILCHKHAVLISTEQRAEELFPKVVSNYTGILYEKIQDGIFEDSLSDIEFKSIYDFSKEFTPYMHFEECINSEESIEDRFEGLVSIYKDRGIDVALWIIDWLGSGIDFSKYSKMYAGRRDLIFQEVAHRIDTCAKVNNQRVIITHQANPGECDNKKLIDEKSCGDTKRLHQDCAWGLGLSALHDSNSPKNDDDGVTLSNEQYLHLFKARRSDKKFWKVYREYAYQRLNEDSIIGDSSYGKTEKPKRR